MSYARTKQKQDGERAMQPAPEYGYLFVDFNSYFASVEQQHDPALRGQPVVVAPTAGEHTSAIAASYEAKALGVKMGTRIADARQICPGLIVRVASPRRYVEYHHRLIAAISMHVPIDKVHSIDEAACKLTGSQREPNNARALANTIKAEIVTQVGPALRCSIGIAATPLLAKIATDLEKPDGLVLLPISEMPGRLAHWKLKDIAGIGSSMERRLISAGIMTIADLWNLPPKQARAIWGGVGGERFWYALHGYEIPETQTSTHSLGHGRVLEQGWRTPDKARLVAREALLRAAQRMRTQNMAAGGLMVSARLANGSSAEAGRDMPFTQDSFALLSALDAAWQDMRLLPRTQIKRLAVYLQRLVPEAQRPGDLFAQNDGVAMRREMLWRLIDAVRANGGPPISLASQAGLHLPDLGTKIAFGRIPELSEFDPERTL
jgi:DNA polymerase IV